MVLHVLLMDAGIFLFGQTIDPAAVSMCQQGIVKEQDGMVVQVLLWTQVARSLGIHIAQEGLEGARKEAWLQLLQA